jgi:hypothetical protein
MPVGDKVSQGDDRYTPEWVFQGLDLTFDLDVCAPKGGIDWIPALKHYSLEDDSLVQDWEGLVWMNPPYSKPTPWVRKFIDHGNGIALLPCSQGKWWYELWDKCDAVMPMPYNMKFINPQGGFRMISFQTSLFAMGHYSVMALSRLNTNKVR